MFYILLIVTFIVSAIVSLAVVRLFSKAADKIFMSIINDPIGLSWSLYLRFAMLVVGISSGVSIYKLERYVVPKGKERTVETLSPERWTLELYSTVISTLKGLAWVLMLFFIVSLIAFMLMRLIEVLRKNREMTDR